MTSLAMESSTELRLAEAALQHCRRIGAFSGEPGKLTRTFLGEAMRQCHAYLSSWMTELGMEVQVDAAGNLRGLYGGERRGSRRILIGSHLDTVPDAGVYDGVLGVVLGISLVEALRPSRLPFAIEVIGFSEEEGVRFGLPFIGSRALVGTLDAQTLQRQDHAGISIEEAIRNFGLDPSRSSDAALPETAAAYLEFHIEQGPVLESIDAPLAAVHSIAGQSRALLTFRGSANHAGTTPMNLRQDALCAAAQWIAAVEDAARETEGLVATVGTIEARPGAANVIPGEVTVTLDVRHARDPIRCLVLRELMQSAENIAAARTLGLEHSVILEQASVAMDPELTAGVARAIEAAGAKPHQMTSGAGHDAMIIASKLPSAMMFIRSPGGLSHHPAETVHAGDVAVAIRAGLHLLQNLLYV